MPTTWLLSRIETAIFLALLAILSATGAWAMHIR
jgi:hypothetical protein